MIPPLMSSTLNGEDILGKKDKTNTGNTQKNTVNQSSEAGRPEKSMDEKSDKTLKNLESKS